MTREPTLGNGEQITVTLPTNVMTQIDAQVGSEFTDRDDFIRTAARHYLDYLQQRSSNEFS